MFCQKCSLHYPDHLSFCRRCGQTLVRSNSETVADAFCCTRCGARSVRGENFCQHCGNRVGVTQQETVIGACYHCGTSWRSGWLFCKTCGLDRKRALLLSTSTSASGLKVNAATKIEEFPEIAKVSCKSCGAEAKPYSRFCESCGAVIDGTGARKPDPEPSASPTGSKLELSSAKRKQNDAQRASAQTIFEPTVAHKPEVNLTEQVKPEIVNTQSGNLSPSAPLQSTVPVAVETRDAAFVQSSSAAVPVVTPAPASSGADAVVHPKTVVTPLPPFGGGFRYKEPTSIRDIWVRNRQAILQSAVLIGMVVLLIALVFWWLNRDERPSLGSLSSQAPSSPVPAAPPSNLPTSAQNPSGQAANNATSDGMVYIPGGTFEMGRRNGDEFETPPHKVTVKPFFIDRTEVTNEAYQLFVAKTGHRPPTHWRDGKFPASGAKLPVVNVSWEDASVYAKWMGKRLPTEAEWEFAARGADGRIYPWGNEWNPSAVNADKENGGNIVEVGRFPNGASPFGVLDMCGNVWEWTADSLRSYADGSKEIAPGKVIRGGAFDVPSNRATATYRGVLPADRLRDKTGFRLARDAQ